jgi:hypothetical protein
MDGKCKIKRTDQDRDIKDIQIEDLTSRLMFAVEVFGREVTDDSNVILNAMLNFIGISIASNAHEMERIDEFAAGVCQVSRFHWDRMRKRDQLSKESGSLEPQVTNESGS